MEPALRPELMVAQVETKRLCVKVAGAAQGKNLVPTSAAQMASMF
jgi:hypothetical protein